MTTSISEFVSRHIGCDAAEQSTMLASLGYAEMEPFIADVVPLQIRNSSDMLLGEGLSEEQALAELRAIASKNSVCKTYIGQGYYGTYTPTVILRNLLENPAWYTAYTPYQPEISQGRLEALLNYQTMVCDLTGMEMANASLLDEATAAAEAMTLCKRSAKNKGNTFFVDQDCLPQTIAVVQTRASHLGFSVLIGDTSEPLPADCFGVLLQYPGSSGAVRDFRELIASAHQQKSMVVMAADILALVLLTSPGELGADVAVGSAQRFGVPMGFGGPHAGYMATQDKFKRAMPGRLVGVSIDAQGKQAYRLALQTREQHIRREKATSNICTAQVLLANIAGMYAVYHGPQGLRDIANRVAKLTAMLADGIRKAGFTLGNDTAFDTITIHSGDKTDAIIAKARTAQLNLREVNGGTLGISLDETTSQNDLEQLLGLFADDVFLATDAASLIPAALLRSDDVLTHPAFNTHHSETEMLRYMRRLADKDIALDRAMIPLGSCTMKLNATSEMIPITWPEFAHIHPFAPLDQSVGYREMIEELEQMLCAATGYDAVSLQPNAGSQGEYAGLLAIAAFHAANGQSHRDICLIPSSAHGTNPASAQLAAMKVVVVKCDENGNVDIEDLKSKASEHSKNLAAIMITYPSTHGVFEEGVRDVCKIVHDHGGQVYIDGANLNAMVGLCGPGEFGGDVSHLNLHKTFCIPHGGGGPGVGPVAVKSHLAPYLPGHATLEGNDNPPVSAAAYGSASILPISWMYIKMMGRDGLTSATENAILSANYITNALKDAYPILYTGSNDLVAHECIIDLRPIEEETGISVEDVAKRLIDFGFHAPTMSFPVAGTLMIEPTESEPKCELDRFIEAMLSIREEIAEVASEQLPANDNPLINAPHTAEVVTADEWDHVYTRSQAAYPVAGLRENKYWPPVGRIDNVYGDRNLVCSCPPMTEYED
ncbi:MAG: aminomethyl-transferring glycine dehydrogenase [Pseudomonadales bacterium]